MCFISSVRSPRGPSAVFSYGPHKCLLLFLSWSLIWDLFRRTSESQKSQLRKTPLSNWSRQRQQQRSVCVEAGVSSPRKAGSSRLHLILDLENTVRLVPFLGAVSCPRGADTESQRKHLCLACVQVTHLRVSNTLHVREGDLARCHARTSSTPC